MFCPNCGNRIEDGAKFCPSCSASIEHAPKAPLAQETPLTGADAPEMPDILECPTPNVQLCADGVYRWFYPFDMRKNPTILFTTWKLETLAVGVTYLLVLLLELIASGDNLFVAAWALGKGFFLIWLFCLFLGVIAYLIVAKIYGWRYLVIFEMGEDSILHKQMESQAEKAQVIAWIALLTARSETAQGAALMAMCRHELSSSFASLRSVRIDRRRDTIKLGERFYHNQIYAAPEDFDFVMNYILARVPEGAKVKEN